MEERLSLGGGLLEPGATVGPYVVVGHLATGGMGEVYLARRSGGEVSVLKVLPHHLAEDERSAQMFIDEARLASSFVHPNIVRVFDSGQGGDLLYFTMEYLRGHPVGTCSKKMVKTGALVPETIAARIIADAALGLAHVHKAKDAQGEPLELVHRDITPDNLFVTYEGITKILDFGVAKVAGSASNTLEGEFKGKVPYMAPETVRGEPADARSDLFSLGVVFFELLTGKKLFGAETPATSLHLLLNEPIPSILGLRPELDPELARICEFLLVREPDRRVQDADMVSEWLETWLRARRVKPKDVANWLMDVFPEAHATSERLLDSLKDTGELQLVDALDLRLLGTGRLGDVKVPDLEREERQGPETAAKVLGEVQPSFSANYYRSLTVDENDSVWAEDSASRIQRRDRRWRTVSISVAATLVLASLGYFLLERETSEPVAAPAPPPVRSAPAVPEPRVVAGRYVLGAELYRDKRGAYHRATEAEGDRAWLVRSFRYPSASDAAGRAQQLEQAKSISEELALPHILSVVTARAEGRDVHLVHPFAEGVPLPLVLEGTLEPLEARRIVRELAALFVAAEHAGLVHGGLRPSDVMLGAQGMLYLSGFAGTATVASAEGADPYRAPEVDETGGSFLADQFALAAISQELLRTFDHEAYLGTARVVAKAMAADPAKRYASQVDFAKALDRALGARSSRRRR